MKMKEVMQSTLTYWIEYIELNTEIITQILKATTIAEHKQTLRQIFSFYENIFIFVFQEVNLYDIHIKTENINTSTCMTNTAIQKKIKIF